MRACLALALSVACSFGSVPARGQEWLGVEPTVLPSCVQDSLVVLSEGFRRERAALSVLASSPPDAAPVPSLASARRPVPAQARRDAVASAPAAPVAARGEARGAAPIVTARMHLDAGTELSPQARRLVLAIREAAHSVPGMDPVFLMAVASRESTFDSDARNGNAAGLFQFMPHTWLVAVHRHAARHGRPELAAAIDSEGGRMTVRDPAMRRRILALRDDPAFAARMAAEMLMGERRELEAALGRPVRSVDLYMTHYMGSGGAQGFLRSLHRPENARRYAAVRSDLETRRARYAGVLARALDPGEVPTVAASAR